MQGQTKERWQRLCERAVDEQDAQRFVELMGEINDLLTAKKDRLQLNRLLSGKEEWLNQKNTTSEDRSTAA